MNGLFGREYHSRGFKSAFRILHTTETSHLRVFNHIFLAIDSGDCVVFILLDLNDGFDSIDHDILLVQTFCASL